MKMKYKIILVILIIEYFVLWYMNKTGIHLDSWIGNALGALVLLAPIFVLLYLIMRDEDISMKFKFWAKIIFWFLLVCYIAGGIGKAIALYG